MSLFIMYFKDCALLFCLKGEGLVFMFPFSYTVVLIFLFIMCSKAMVQLLLVLCFDTFVILFIIPCFTLSLPCCLYLI